MLDDLARGHRAAVPDGRRASSRSTCSTPRRTRDALAERLRRRPALRRARARRRVRRAPRALLPQQRRRHAATCSTRCATHGVERLVFSSTCATYGEPERGPDRRGHADRPGQRLRRLQARGRPHDRRRVRARTGSARSRCATSTSPARAATLGEDHDPETHLIPLVLQAAAGPARPRRRCSAPTTRRRDGTAVRDYIHVEDLGRGAPARARARPSPARTAIYNLGNGAGFSVREVIEAARARHRARRSPSREEPRRARRSRRARGRQRARSATSSAGSREKPSSRR